MNKFTQYPQNNERQQGIAKLFALHLNGQGKQDSVRRDGWGRVSPQLLEEVEHLLEEAYLEGYFEAYIDHSEQERRTTE